MEREKKTIRVGFDLDGVVAKHSLGGFWVRIRRLKEEILKKLHTDAYYYPKTTLERGVWKIINWLRIPDVEGINLARGLKKKGWKFYLITGRFNFNYPLTVKWLKRHNLYDFFEKVYVNVGDVDPTVFKKEKIKQEKIDFFIDDDLEVLNNLNGECLKLLWVVPKHRNGSENGYHNINTCKDLHEALKKCL